MKKYSAYIVAIPLAIVFTILFIFAKKEYQKQENKKLEPKQASLIEESMPDKYGGEVIQVGGNGSMMHQTTVSLILEAVGYLKPAEDWVSVWFNSPAYLMNVDCREGYKMYLCKVNDVDGVIDEHPFGCTAKLNELGNTPRNKVNIACIKNTLPSANNLQQEDDKFDNYKISSIINGKQAPLNLKSHVRGLEFKTAITDEYKKGPNFANHYTVVEWGCGTNCQNHVIVDNLTGNIIDAEIGSAYGVEYKLNSRLFVVNPKKVLIDSFGDDIPEYFKTAYYELLEDELKMKKIEN